MATLTLWKLPLNPPNPYGFYVQFLSDQVGGEIFYTKYIVDVIGRLRVDATTNNVHEWAIPPVVAGGASGGAGPSGIVHVPGQGIWFAAQSAHRLVEFDPKTGRFRAYGGPAGGFPIRSPRHLLLDRGGNVWYTGSGTNGALVGKLDSSRAFATYWDLPIELLTPEGLWVDEDGTEVWLTPINSNIGMKGAFLARLDVGKGDVTLWSPPAPGASPTDPGVWAEPSRTPRNVWFTLEKHNNSRIYRFHRPSGTFFEYASAASPISKPRRIALDTVGNAWISDWGGYVSTIARDSDCGTASFVEVTHQVPSQTMSVTLVEAYATPVEHSVSPTTQGVAPTASACITHYPLPSPVMSHGIVLVQRRSWLPGWIAALVSVALATFAAIVSPVTRRPIVIGWWRPQRTEIYFTHGSSDTIGRLVP